MVGLIRKNLLTSGFRRKHYFIMFLCLIIISFVAPIDNYIPIIVYSLLTLVPGSVILSIVNQTSADDYKNELILPVKRSQIVLAKYLIYLISLFIILPVIVTFLLVNYKMGRIVFENYEINLMLLGVGITLLFGSLLIPAIFLFQQDKIKVIGIVSFILTIVPIRFFMIIMKNILDLNNIFDVYKYKYIIPIFILVCMCLFAMSGIVSNIIFSKKEF